MRLKTFLFFVIVAGVLIAFWGRFQQQQQKELQAYQLGIKAYIYAYPLVLLATTRDIMTAVKEPTDQGMAPVNQFGHIASLPTDETKFIVRPNVDTLYSVAWLDLTQGPQVLSVPAIDRYYLLEILDAWTDVIASPGSRTSGNDAQGYLITGPGWHGSIPHGLRQIQAPTNLVWILGRIQVNGSRDVAHVQALQKGLRLSPLSSWPQKKIAPAPAIAPAAQKPPAPADAVARLSMEAFFSMFTQLLKDNPAHAADAALIKELATIGIVAGKPFPAQTLGPVVMRELKRGFEQAKKLLKMSTPPAKSLVNGWMIPPQNIGQYGADYRTRAFIAYHGVGANLPADAIYPTALVDADGKKLSGENCYVIHFEKGQLPPVQGFWSVTLYGPDDFLVKNRLHRYALGNRDRLFFNSNGSLDLYVKKAPPGKNRDANWIPAPAGEFSLTARLYWPDKSALDGSWQMPAIQRATCTPVG